MARAFIGGGVSGGPANYAQVAGNIDNGSGTNVFLQGVFSGTLVDSNFVGVLDPTNLPPNFSAATISAATPLLQLDTENPYGVILGSIQGGGLNGTNNAYFSLNAGGFQAGTPDWFLGGDNGGSAMLRLAPFSNKSYPNAFVGNIDLLAGSPSQTSWTKNYTVAGGQIYLASGNDYLGNPGASITVAGANGAPGKILFQGNLYGDGSKLTNLPAPAMIDFSKTAATNAPWLTNAPASSPDMRADQFGFLCDSVLTLSQNNLYMLASGGVRSGGYFAPYATPLLKPYLYFTNLSLQIYTTIAPSTNVLIFYTNSVPAAQITNAVGVFGVTYLTNFGVGFSAVGVTNIGFALYPITTTYGATVSPYVQAVGTNKP